MPPPEPVMEAIEGWKIEALRVFGGLINEARH
jgi:hypothetical protein